MLPLACLAFFSAIAHAQTPAEEEPELLVSIDVGYNTAFREGTWVPVDVLVVNEQESFTGWVEVRSYTASNDLQSPTYRIPADCPKDSRKRFRLHCYLDNAYRIEAWLYDENNRPQVEVPAYIQLQPIAGEDLLGLVLDDEALNFSFLPITMRQGALPQRLHRQNLPTGALGFLPDYAQCYRDFNFIVLGEIDPTRVAAHHRQLLVEYVESGGVLVVMTGAIAQLYRGSWIEPLLGVTIGESESITESAFAEAVFEDEAMRIGARDDRDLLVTNLAVADPNVELLGNQRPIAALRPLGRGYVCTLAVDAKSQALQGVYGYQRMWYELMTARRPDTPLNMDALTVFASQQLPNVSGVTIKPLSSVMTYLLLYIGLGIVGNWIFWSRMKRRELAWVTLFFVSIGFTAYAIFFGTAGWAKSSEQQQVEVVRLPQGDDDAEYNALVGVLTARTRAYEATLTQDSLLARDASIFNTAIFQQGLVFGGMQTGQQGRTRPFRFVQTSPPAIENFRVGASELRLARVEGRVPIQGQFEGALRLEDGAITGSIVNVTGLKLNNVSLIADGAMLELKGGPTRYDVNFSAEVLEQARHEAAQNDPSQIYYMNMGYLAPGQGSAATLRPNMLRTLLSDPEMTNVVQLDLDHPAYIAGWLDQPLMNVMETGEELVETISQTLVLAEIPLERPGGIRVPLSVANSGSRSFGSGRFANVDPVRLPAITPATYPQYEQWLSLPGKSVIDIYIPDRVYNDPNAALHLTLYWRPQSSRQEAPATLFIGPTNSHGRRWHEENVVGEAEILDTNMDLQRVRYTLQNWRDYVNDASGVVSLGIWALYEDNLEPPLDPNGEIVLSPRDQARLGNASFAIAAEAELDPNATQFAAQRGDLLQWLQ